MVNLINNPRIKNKRVWLLCLGIFFLILPLFLEGRYYLNILILSFIWAVVAASWNLILGYAKIFSFGQIAFFVIGGYSSSLLVNYLEVSPWLGLLVGGITASIFGIIIGIPCLKLSGLYLAMVTFAVHLVLPVFITWAGPGRFENFSTGGTFGLHRVAPLNFFGYVFSRRELTAWYYVAFALFIIFLFLIYKIINSSIGLAFVALRDAGPLAESLGINKYKYKLIVFMISSFIAGVMGSFYAHYLGSISPEVLELDVFLLILIMPMFGGLGVFPGAAIGGFVIYIINELLRPLLVWRYVVLGIIVILTMTYMPKGLMGFPELLDKIKKRLQPADQKLEGDEREHD